MTVHRHFGLHDREALTGGKEPESSAASKSNSHGWSRWLAELAALIRLREPLSISSLSKVPLWAHGLPAWARYGAATLLVLATALLRSWFAAGAPGYPFVLFFPAIVISALFFAQGSGVWAALLSTAVIASLILLPLQRFDATGTGDLLTLVLFLAVGVATAVMIELLHRAFFALAQANAELAAARDRIAAAEHEKEVLLQELTHRFKNDLASLAGLLRLQARSVADPTARSELLAASERVHVMARVHQRLTRFGDPAQVDIREFLTDLCEDLRTSSVGLRPIALRAEVEDHQFPISEAVGVGLITNELVTNALKYAFPGERPGTISVRLFQDGNEFKLAVSDDGVGGPIGPASGNGLGQRLIRSLAQQLGGSLEINVDAGGRVCTVRFPANRIVRQLVA